MYFSCEFIVNEKKRKIPHSKNVYLVKKNARFRVFSFSFIFFKVKKRDRLLLKLFPLWTCTAALHTIGLSAQLYNVLLRYIKGCGYQRLALIGESNNVI